MSEQPALSFQGMCHYIGRLIKASKAGMKAALADCPKCHFTILEALVHTIACSGQDGAICVSDLPAVRSGSRRLLYLRHRPADPGAGRPDGCSAQCSDGRHSCGKCFPRSKSTEGRTKP